MGRTTLRKPGIGTWPLAARVPLIGAILILVVGLGISKLALSWIAAEQERSMERLTTVYVDGLSASIVQRVLTGDRDGIADALRRSMLFQAGIRERQLIVHGPRGEELARESLSGARLGTLTPALRERLERSGGLIIDEAGEIGWAYRTLFDGAQPVARIYAELDLEELLAQRQRFRLFLALYSIGASIVGAILTYLLIRRLLRPVSVLTSGLAKAESGELAPVPESELGPPRTEFGRLLRSFNAMIRSLREREALAARLAQQERSSVLGRLAATIAHEVRNPLGGMFNAVDTVRKFGADPAIRAHSLNLIERGLASIRDVVTATLATHRGSSEGRAFTAEDLADLRILVAPEARRRALRVEWSAEIAGAVPVDAGLVRQLLLNLLLNACVAAPRGSTIRFSASVAEDELRLAVADDGPGLPENVRASLTSIDEAVAEGASPGIGLSVVRQLVDQLGGRIDAGPNADARGTLITLHLPLRLGKLADAAD